MHKELERVVNRYQQSDVNQVTKDEYIRRLSICNNCELRKYKMCKAVNRTLTAFAKYKRRPCPEGKWGDAIKIQRNLPSVAVVIISHNYGKFLKESIDSALRQTVAPDEVLVIDDASVDNTEAIAKQYRFVKYVKVDNKNPYTNRGLGFRLTKSDVICFLDADDYLPKRYLEQGLAEFHGNIGVVYSDMQLHTKDNSARNFKDEITHDDIGYRNYIHAASLVKREALEISECFKYSPERIIQDDWFMWKQVLKYNYRAVKQPCIYQYRKHGNNSSDKRDKSNYYNLAGLRFETIDLFIPFSGRIWVLRDFINFLDNQKWPKDQINLIAYNTSSDPKFIRMLKQWIYSCEYPYLRYIERPMGKDGLADKNRRNSKVADDVRITVSKIYNDMLRLIENHYVWVLEDDIIPPIDVVEKLLRGFNEKAVSVAAPYLSRFHDGYVAWDYSPKGRRHIRSKRNGYTTVGGNGFGCTIFRKPVLKNQVFRCYRDFDIEFYNRIRDKITVVCWDAECEHRSKE